MQNRKLMSKTGWHENGFSGSACQCGMRGGGVSEVQVLQTTNVKQSWRGGKQSRCRRTEGKGVCGFVVLCLGTAAAKA